MKNIDIDFPVPFAKKFSLTQDLDLDDVIGKGLIQHYQGTSDQRKEHKTSFDSFFSQSALQTDYPQVPRWGKQHTIDRWHPVQGRPPYTGWYDSWQKPQRSHFSFGSGPTIDRGNTLKHRSRNNRSFDSLVVFGDSLSDTGQFSEFIFVNSDKLGSLFPFPPYPPYAQSGTINGDTNGAGRLSNGNLWVEYFATDLGLTKQEVDNLAFIGATTGAQNIAPVTAADFIASQGGNPTESPVKEQLGLLSTLLSGNPSAGVLKQVQEVQKVESDDDPLHVVWGGANDFITLLADPTPANLVNLVLAGVNNVGTAVTQLAQKGAETIVVPNLPNLGRTPFANGQNTQGQNFVPAATLFSVGFNLVLQPILVDLERQLKKNVDKDVDIVQIDIFSLSEDIARRPKKFGFTNTTDPLFTQNPLTNPDPDKFVFADNFHPTTAVHQEFADLFEKSLTRPVASQVFENSSLVIKDLIASNDGASFLNSLLGSAAALPLGGNASPFQQMGVLLGADAIFG